MKTTFDFLKIRGRPSRVTLVLKKIRKDISYATAKISDRVTRVFRVPVSEAPERVRQKRHKVARDPEKSQNKFEKELKWVHFASEAVPRLLSAHLPQGSPANGAGFLLVDENHSTVNTFLANKVSFLAGPPAIGASFLSACVANSFSHEALHPSRLELMSILSITALS